MTKIVDITPFSQAGLNFGDDMALKGDFTRNANLKIDGTLTFNPSSPQNV